MLYIRPGSQVWQLITLLSFVGEYPVRSLHLLGNERVYKALVHKLTTVQIYRLPQTDLTMETRLLTVTGKANGKTIRLYKSALPILDWIHPDAYRYYMDAFWSHRFPGDAAHWERNHRVAEAAAMFISAGVEAQPYLLPHLQTGIQPTDFDKAMQRFEFSFTAPFHNGVPRIINRIGFAAAEKRRRPFA